MEQGMVGAEGAVPGAAGLNAFPGYWRILIEQVRARYFYLDLARIEDAVAEVVLRRWEQGERVLADLRREGAGRRVGSLYDSVCLNLSNALRGEARRLCREREYALRKKKSARQDFCVLEAHSAEIEDRETKWENLQELLPGLAAWEQAFVELRRQGVEDVRAYADLLGADEQTPAEEGPAVRRAWNRIRMKLRRLHARRQEC